MSAERICLLAMAAGLVMIGQPWMHIAFLLGFPITLLAIIAYNWVTRKDA